MAAIDDKKRLFLGCLDEAASKLQYAIVLGSELGEDVSTLETELDDLKTEIQARKDAIAS